MKGKSKRKIINISALSLMVLFVGTVLYMAVLNDPIVETEYDTGNDRTSLIIREHTKTGEKDYIYGVIDGVGAIKNP